MVLVGSWLGNGSSPVSRRILLAAPEGRDRDPVGTGAAKQWGTGRRPRRFLDGGGARSSSYCRLLAGVSDLLGAVAGRNPRTSLNAASEDGGGARLKA